MDTTSILNLIGGLGLFLLGIQHLTDGIKGLAGDSLRRALQLLVSGKWSGLLSGAVFTAVIQSSSAATLTVIGFVSAGLVTFSQAVSVILGANLGTTATAWIVAIFGFKLKISAAAMPIVGIGAFLWLLAKGRPRALGASLAGFGLIFIGIDFLQVGMAGIEWNLTGLSGGDLSSQWILAGIGAVMTVVMQSSSAAAATTLVALNAGSIDLTQACAMVIGQNIGTTTTAAMATPGGGLSVRRTALAHILFNVITGVICMFLLEPLVRFSDWCATPIHDPEGVITLATFNTLTKVGGIALFMPWLGAFSRIIIRISGKEPVTAASRLNPTLAKAGGGVALEAAWRALLDLAREAVTATRDAMDGGKAVPLHHPEAVEQTRDFLGHLRSDSSEPDTLIQRNVRLWHALDHLDRLNEDLSTIPGRPENWRPPPAFREASAALNGWLDATTDPNNPPDPAVLEALHEASSELARQRKNGREELLEQVALGHTDPTRARSGLELLLWADGALYHCWRLANSLQIASSHAEWQPSSEPEPEPFGHA